VTAVAWRCLLAATALMALVMGSRTATGLFVSPLNTATGVGLAGLGFAVALGQLAQGLAQPPLGWLADRYGSRRLIVTGALLLCLATMMLTLADSIFAFSLTFVVIAIASTAVGSNSLLLAEVGRRVPAERRAMAFAIVGAGGSAGQLLIAPGAQAIMDANGWLVALGGIALLSLLALPLARVFGTGDGHAVATSHQATNQRLNDVLRRPTFWLIAGSFSVCGFHVGYLTTHMPGVIERCGLSPSLAGVWFAVLGAANIVGSLLAGVCLRHVSTHNFLIGVFSVRAASVVSLLLLPVSSEVMLGFAVVMGLSYMALLPAISQQLTERFGIQRLATVFGVVSLVHQIGSFAGAWLGGVVAEATGGDELLWVIDIGLALTAVAFQMSLASTARGASKARDEQRVANTPAEVERQPKRRAVHPIPAPSGALRTVTATA